MGTRAEAGLVQGLPDHMMDLDRINDAIAEAGPLDDEILDVRRMADDLWAIVIAEETVAVEADPDLGRLMFSAPLGALPEERRAALIELMMSYAAMWRDTGGVRIGLNRPEGEPFVMLDLAEEAVTPKAIAAMAVATATRALQWRALIALGTVPDAPPPSFLDDTMIIRG